MIVEITSLTPRVTLSRPAMPAHIAPTTIATSRPSTTLSRPGTRAAPTVIAAAYEATWYWPSTPMLNRFIRKPMAAASADRKIIDDWLTMLT
jgi:hypothetical protein